MAREQYEQRGFWGLLMLTDIQVNGAALITSVKETHHQEPRKVCLTHSEDRLAPYSFSRQERQSSVCSLCWHGPCKGEQNSQPQMGQPALERVPSSPSKIRIGKADKLRSGEEPVLGFLSLRKGGAD